MPDVIVMGGNYSSALGVTRSLGEAGYKVRLLTFDKTTRNIVGKSKYVEACCRVKRNYAEAYRALVKLRGEENRILIIPLDDASCLMLDEHAEELSAHYVFPNINREPGALSRFLEKMPQKELARQCGIPVAAGQAYHTDAGGIEKAVSEVRYPCFMKPLASAKCIAGKDFFAKCDTGEELRRAMNHARNRHACETVLVEDFLYIEKELCAYGVAGNGSVFIPACVETLRGGYGCHKGVAIEGTVTSAGRLGALKEKLETYVKRSGLTGMFCIDMIRSNGIIFFSEMNLRNGGSGYGVTLAGVNLPGALADMVYRESGQGPEDIRRDVRFLSERLELDACADGFISIRDYETHLAGGQERFIEDEKDPRPWDSFKKTAFRKLLKRRVKSIFGR